MAFARFTAEDEVTHVVTYLLSNRKYFLLNGPHNFEKLTISQIAVWWSSGWVKGLVSEPQIFDRTVTLRTTTNRFLMISREVKDDGF